MEPITQHDLFTKHQFDRLIDAQEKTNELLLQLIEGNKRTTKRKVEVADDSK